MVMGDIRAEDAVLVRVHTENVTCDMFGSLIDDSGFQLHTALEKIAAAGQGVVLYLRQREHSLDLVNQLRTYAVMQEKTIGKREASLETASPPRTVSQREGPSESRPINVPLSCVPPT